jgi:hypothetical protein
MNIDQFWTIVDRVHDASGGDMDTKCKLLAEELRRLSPDEVFSFGEHFGECFYQADTWDIWGAAFVIHDGCGDDSFMDFRSTLISQGRSVFEAALTDADSLAQFNIDPAWATYEGYQYVPGKIYEEKAGSDPPDRPDSDSRPKETRGVPFKEWEMSTRFPRLVGRYNYKDSDWFCEKERQEKAARNKVAAEHLASLLLDSGIIPTCGLIPPLGIVRNVLRTGKSPEITGKHHTWQPFELEEEDYWGAAVLLEKLSPEDPKDRPDLRTRKFKHDTTSTKTDDFGSWIQTLKERGLA